MLAYDPLARLFQVSGGTTTKFAYDGLNMLSEYDAANALLRRYVFAPGMDRPITWYEGSGTTDRRFLSTDERGSIISVTDSSGAVVATNTYDEYGIPGATNLGRFQYTGQAWLTELGMYYYKARVYSPTLGRFLQTDPIGYAGGANLYAYVVNDPINLIDPLGLRWILRCVGEIGHEHCSYAWVEDGSAGGPPIPSSPPSGPGTAPGGPGGAGGPPKGTDDQCPLAPGTEYSTAQDAALAGAQDVRAQQNAAKDNNERSWGVIPTQTSTFTFYRGLIGTFEDVNIPIRGTAIGGGHSHTAGGGDTLSRSLDSRYDRPRDYENIMAGLREMGTDRAKDFLTILAGESGRVLTWTGKNLNGDGKDIGPDTCTQKP